METNLADRKHIQRQLRNCGPLMDVVRVAANFLKWNFLVSLTFAFLGMLVGMVFGNPAAALMGGFVGVFFSICLWAGIMLLLEETSARKRDLCIFLRAFRSDAAADQLRAWLKAALGPRYKLSGILPPAKRATVWTRLASPLITGLSYLGSRQFEMEAGDHNWMARLLATFSKTRFVFMDVRDTTPHVRDEIELAWSVFGQHRVIFVVDDSKTPDQWRSSIGQLLGRELDLQESPKMIVWPESSAPDSQAFSKSVAELMKTVPHGTPAISKEALAFVEARVPPPQWQTRLHERGGLIILCSLVFSTCFVLIFPLAGLIYGFLLGLTVQVFFWKAWRRARRQRKFAAMINADGPPSGKRLWLSAVGVGLPGVVSITALLAAFLIPVYSNVSRQSEDIRDVNNAKQIISLCMMYAAENDGQFPDSMPNPVTGRLPSSSNEAFRAFFQEGGLHEEGLFGCARSPFVPDRNIGLPPTFDKALSEGENHWAMTRGINNTDAPDVPLIFENPAVPTWPPLWNADAKGRPEAGRARADGTIIVGRNDGSVSVMKLDGDSGFVGIRSPVDGPPVFKEGGKALEVLNVEP